MHVETMKLKLYGQENFLLKILVLPIFSNDINHYITSIGYTQEVILCAIFLFSFKTEKNIFFDTRTTLKI